MVYIVVKELKSVEEYWKDVCIVKKVCSVMLELYYICVLMLKNSVYDGSKLG